MSFSLNGLKGLIFPNGSRQGTAGNSFMTYGGTANAITLTDGSDGDTYTLAVGQRFYFRATAQNTGATTINVNGLGNVACVTPTGVALPSGFIRTDVSTEVEYDGTNFVVYRRVQYLSDASNEAFLHEDGSMTNINRTGLVVNTGNTLGSAGGSATYSFSYLKPFAGLFPAPSFGYNVGTGSQTVASDFTIGFRAISFSSITVCIKAVQGLASTQTVDVSITLSGRWY